MKRKRNKRKYNKKRKRTRNREKTREELTVGGTVWSQRVCSFFSSCERAQRTLDLILELSKGE
jgi:hypothetical protein